MKRWILPILLAVTSSLAAEIKILAFAGSARSDSYNKKLVEEAVAIARSMGAKVNVIDLKDYPMPIYDADEESSKGMPLNAKRFRSLMVESDGIIISSPDYNGSVSGLLKNALDWASRSDGDRSHSAFEGKKFAIMSVSPGRGGGARNLPHLQAIIECLGGKVVQKKVSVPSARNAFNEKGRLKDPATLEALRQEISQLISA